MLSAQRYGQEQRRFYYWSWILDPNGYMVAHADSGPGYFVCRLPIGSPWLSLGLYLQIVRLGSLRSGHSKKAR